MKLNINKIAKIFFVSLGITLLMPSAITMADTTSTTATSTAPAAAGKCAKGVIFPNWYDGLCDSSTGDIKSPNSLNGGAGDAASTSKNIGGWIAVIALNVVQMLLYIVGYVSIGFIIYGGFKYMISGDSSAGTVAARKTIQNAIIGLVLSIMSVAIIKFVTGAIGGS